MLLLPLQDRQIVMMFRGFSKSVLRGAILATALAVAALVPAKAQPAPEPLVSVSWLKAHLRDPGVVVLDVRSAIDGGGEEAYVKAHIPGALHTDYDKAGWRVMKHDIPFMLPNTLELEKLVGETGIEEDNHVVVVPAGVSATDFGSAARVYWTLKYLGMKQLSILDGGMAAWAADAANPVESGATRADPKIFTASIDNSVVATVSEVEKISASGGATLVDARAPSVYLGKEITPFANVYGHIPGAVNVDNENLYDSKTNRLKPKAELAKLTTAVPSGPAVNYCNTGHWASIDWFVLSEILGRKDARLFPGSMVEWSAGGSTRPVASSRTKLDDLKKTLGLGQ
jgi:thiosulfate/3-mercaptopyruvate sulfurtransferase